MDISCSRCIDNFFKSCIQFSETDISCNRVLIEPSVLQHHAELGAQIGAGQLFCVVAIYFDGSRIHFIEAHQKIDHRGLTGAGRTDDSHSFPAFDLDVKILDQRIFFIIAERNIFKSDVSADLLRQTRFHGTLHFLFLVKEIEDALDGRSSRLDDGRQLCDCRDRLVHLPDILHHSLHIPYRHHSRHRLQNPEHSDDDIGSIGYERHSR